MTVQHFQDTKYFIMSSIKVVCKPLNKYVRTFCLRWVGLAMPTQQKSDRRAAVPEQGRCLHVLHALEGDTVHLEDAVPFLDLPMTSSCPRWVQAGDVQTLQLLCNGEGREITGQSLRVYNKQGLHRKLFQW